MISLVRCAMILSIIGVFCPTTVYANCDTIQPPLSTSQQYIVDANGCNVVLKSVNWFGGESAALTPGGLDKQSLAAIVLLIKQAGFNSVRLPWANEMVERNPEIDKRYLAANPLLQGKTALEVFDQVVDAFGDAGLLVILDNHRSRGDWCCDADHGDGLWYSNAYPANHFFDDWITMVKRYQNRPFVIAAELRNEIRSDNILHLKATWGDGNPKTDWKIAATNAANLILKQNSNLLIMVGGIRWQVDLADIKTSPLRLTKPNKLVYVAHDYAWDHDEEDLTDPIRFAASAYQRWGFVLEPNKPYTAPLYLSEWGGCTQLDSNGKPCSKGRYQFVDAFVNYLCHTHQHAPVSWAYWPLNATQMAGYSRKEGKIETYGLLKPDWKTWASPELINNITKVGCDTPHQ